MSGREITTQEYKGAVDLAHSEGVYYFSWRTCRRDYWWRAIHSPNNMEVMRALTLTHLALALPNSNLHWALENRQCEAIETKLNPERNLGCDSCVSVHAANPQAIKFGVGTSGNISEDERRMANDINERGVVVFAEMQQRKELVTRNGVQVDRMDGRMSDYGALIMARDIGKKNERLGKDAQDEIARPVVGVAYQCYGDMGSVNQYVNNSGKGSAVGQAFAHVGLGDMSSLSKDNLMAEARRRCGIKDLNRALNDGEKGGVFSKYEEIVKAIIARFNSVIGTHLHALSDYTKELSMQILATFSMSHLFTRTIVDGFLPVVQSMCKILEVNMENVRSGGWTKTEIESLLGRFNELQRAKEETRRSREKDYADKIKSIADKAGAVFKAVSEEKWPIKNLNTFQIFVQNPELDAPVITELQKKPIPEDLDLQPIKEEITKKYAETVESEIQKNGEISVHKFCSTVPETWLRHSVLEKIKNDKPLDSAIVTRIEPAVYEVSQNSDEIVATPSNAKILINVFYSNVAINLQCDVLEDVKRKLGPTNSIVIQLENAIRAREHVEAIFNAAVERRAAMLQNVPEDLRPHVQEILEKFYEIKI